MTGEKARRYMRRSEGEWRRLIAGQKESGLSVTAYCLAKSLSLANFYRWRTRINCGSLQDTSPAPCAMPSFVDLGPVALPRETVGRFEFRIEIGRIFTLMVRG